MLCSMSCCGDMLHNVLHVVPHAMLQAVPHAMLHAVLQAMPHAVLHAMPHAVLHAMPHAVHVHVHVCVCRQHIYLNTCADSHLPHRPNGPYMQHSRVPKASAVAGSHSRHSTITNDPQCRVSTSQSMTSHLLPYQKVSRVPRS